MTDRLTALQRQVLAVVAAVEPPWTLTDGAALAGFHLQHRTTRDLELFWHGLRTWQREPEDCVERLEAAGLRVEVLQRTPAFVRLRASDANETVVVDLVAEAVGACLPPEWVRVGAVSIRVDSAQEILANKLGALLHRAELRDLVDIRGLLARGCDLSVALQHAAAKDLGFSPVMVAHLLEQFPVDTQGQAEKLDAGTVTELRAFAKELSRRIVGDCQPERCDAPRLGTIPRKSRSASTHCSRASATRRARCSAATAARCSPRWTTPSCCGSSPSTCIARPAS